METIITNSLKKYYKLIDIIMFDLTIHTNGDFVLIEVPVKQEYVSYKYEIYGNNKFFSSGILEIIGKEVPLITFNLDNLEDTIFFIKVSAKLESLTENETYFSFYNHEETKIKKNLIMEIREPNNIPESTFKLSKLPFSDPYSDSTEGDGEGDGSEHHSNTDNSEDDSEN
jgi:hypothetical protein